MLVPRLWSCSSRHRLPHTATDPRPFSFEHNLLYCNLVAGHSVLVPGFGGYGKCSGGSCTTCDTVSDKDRKTRCPRERNTLQHSRPADGRLLVLKLPTALVVPRPPFQLFIIISLCLVYSISPWIPLTYQSPTSDIFPFHLR